MHGEKRFQGKTHKILHFSSSDYSACINHGLAEIQGSRLIHPFLNQFKAEQAEVLLNIIRIRYVEYNLMLRCQSTQKMFCAEDTQCIRQHMTGSHQSDAAWTFAIDQFFSCMFLSDFRTILSFNLSSWKKWETLRYLKYTAQAVHLNTRLI